MNSEENKSLRQMVEEALEPIKKKHNVTPMDRTNFLFTIAPVFIGLVIYRESGITEIVRYILDSTGEFVLFNPRISEEYRDEVICNSGGTGGVQCIDLARYMDMTEHQVMMVLYRRRLPDVDPITSLYPKVSISIEDDSSDVSKSPIYFGLEDRITIDPTNDDRDPTAFRDANYVLPEISSSNSRDEMFQRHEDMIFQNMETAMCPAPEFPHIFTGHENVAKGNTTKTPLEVRFSELDLTEHDKFDIRYDSRMLCLTVIRGPGHVEIVPFPLNPEELGELGITGQNRFTKENYETILKKIKFANDLPE